MEFKDQIKQLGEKVFKLKDQIKTEEATKSAFIMPFIQLLGYDLFNPLEVVPEFITDFGAKNVEKVDYAILKDNEPILIIECKHHIEQLDKHYTQTHKYFHLTKSRFSILTNGIQYNFYTDLDMPNKMDEKPFLSFDITCIKEQQIKELAKFHKSGFDVSIILNTANELKYSNAIKRLFTTELANPSPDFIKFFASRIYDGRLTEKIMLQLSEIFKKSIDQIFNDIVSDRLMNAINQTKPAPVEEPVQQQEIEDQRVVTTEEEINGFYIVKSIIRNKVNCSRIFYRDSINYLSIILDDNNKKPICRLWLNGQKKKYIGLLDKDKKETKYEITSLDDIYNYSDQLSEAAEFYGG